MKKIIILRGLPGSGKSTLIEHCGLGDYSLSLDKIRLLMSSPKLSQNGKMMTPEDFTGPAVALFHKMLEERMNRGELLVLDNTFLEEGSFEQMEAMIQKYFYQALYIDFTLIPLEKIFKQNKQRKEIRIASEKSIYRMANNIKPLTNLSKNSTLHHFESVEKTGAFIQQWMEVPVLDLSSFSKIIHIGDIQGCYSVLMEPGSPLSSGFKEDIAYIFTGDLLDRGIENGDVLSWFLREALPKHNVFLVAGNHEKHLEKWASGAPIFSEEFSKHTLPQLLNAGIKPEDVVPLIEKMTPILLYHHQDTKVMVTHGGISTVPKIPALISEYQYTHGTGYWDSKVGEQFHLNAPQGWIQVHGHRMRGFSSIQTSPRNFCVEGKVEAGGELRWVTYSSEDGWVPGKLRNKVYKTYRDRGRVFNRAIHLPWMEKAPSHFLTTEEWNSLSEHPGVLIKPLSSHPHIAAINFKKDVFFNKTWDDVVVKARGLFVNIHTREIVARGYDKFFNLNEREETTLNALKNTLVFPINLFVKENGFLGNIGYDSETDSLFVATKSTADGYFSKLFTQILHTKLTEEQRDGLRQYLRDQEATMTFEVISPEHDPHMISYAQPDIILLDVFHRTSTSERVDFNQLQSIAKHFNLPCKQMGIRFNRFEEFLGWYQKNESNLNYQHNHQWIEGFVIEDAKGFQTKIKLPYYSFWKRMRGLKDYIYKERKAYNDKLSAEIERVGRINTIRIEKNLSPLEMPQEKDYVVQHRDTHPLAVKFANWCIAQPIDTLSKDIIQLREAFEHEIPDAKIDYTIPWNPFSVEQNKKSKPPTM